MPLADRGWTVSAAVRVRMPDDMKACIDVLAAVHRSDAYPLLWPEHPERWLTPRALIEAWVGEEKGSVAGHIALCTVVGESAASVWGTATGVPVGGMAAIERFFVSPQARGRGLGRALLSTAQDEARERGMRCVLEVLDHNSSAIALYEAMGWRRIGSGPAPWAEGRVKRPVLQYYVADV
jgi:GNAT superfamily N-acetyltransferase